MTKVRNRARTSVAPRSAATALDPDLFEEIKVVLAEVRAMLVEMRRSQGDERAGARSGPMIFRDEKLIPLEDAVALVWSASTARSKEGREIHAKILRLFGTMGLNGTVLETTIRRKRWHTSREAVERFMAKAFGRRPTEGKVERRLPRRQAPV